MTQLVSTDSPRDVVARLLELDDEEELEVALADLAPAVAARAVIAAPSLEQKTTLLWAMDDLQRRRALEFVPPPIIGALVQNAEEDNRYLLGDLSLEQFRALLQLCSPERKYYWITTALSFTDARANALPLLLTNSELVEILFTRAEFEQHVRTIGDYPIEEQRLPPDLLADPAQAIVDLLGPENMLRQFPVTEPKLAQVLQTVLDYDIDRYVDIIRGGLRLVDYQEGHPEEWETLTEEPILLDALDPVGAIPDELLDPIEESPADLLPGADEETPVALVPLSAAPLARTMDALAPAVCRQVAAELQYLYVREAVAAGGSFLQSDLNRAARSVEAYLLLGLRTESGGDPRREGAVLASRPLNKVSQTGARSVERLRQVALRLQPLERVLGTEQRALVRSLLKPQLTVSREGEPRLVLRGSERLAEEADLDTVERLLRETASWTTTARALGLERTAEALTAAGSLEVLEEELALGAVLYQRVEYGLADREDARRFASRYLREGGPGLDDARAGLARVVGMWAAERRIAAENTVPRLELALERVTTRLAGDTASRPER